MNDRIKKLADQASENIRYRIDPHTFKHIDDPNGPYIRVEFNKEKFAELIVRECMSLCEDLKMQHKGYRMEETDSSMKNIYAEGEATCDLLQYKMKEHFGVEE